MSSLSILNKLKEALDNPKWKPTMIAEIEALKKKKKKLIHGYKWAFTVKHKVDDFGERFKAKIGS